MLADTVLALGVNHKVAPVEVREKLVFCDSDVPLERLMAVAGCKECCFLSTCNRVEVLFVSDSPEKTAADIRAFLFSKSGLGSQEAEQYTYLHQGRSAVNHLFRVASSLDSMIVGEPQILGQLKQAFREATEEKTAGVILNRLMDKSFSVAKRIRTETNIGGSAVSISYAAVQLAKKIFGSLHGKRVLLVGAGEMAELAAEHLVAQGIEEVVVANRTVERAVTLARRFNGKAVSLGELVEQLEYADILISSTGATDLVLRKKDVKPIMRKRMNSPLFLIDIAVPRDLDPELNSLENVYLYDIDNLKDVVEINKGERDKEAEKAERIVTEESLKFLDWLGGMEVSPVIAELRAKADAIRDAELARTLSKLGNLSHKEQKSIEVMTSSLISKLLHDPIQFIKLDTVPVRKQVKLDMVRQVFGLDKIRQDPDE